MQRRWYWYRLSLLVVILLLPLLPLFHGVPCTERATLNRRSNIKNINASSLHCEHPQKGI